MTTPTGPAGLLPGPVVLTSVVPGYAVIPSPTPLTFLNYYDGKFLRASDLRQEQLGIQSMIQLSNQAAGAPGVAYGFDVTLGSGDTLTLSAGLGIDPQGRMLYLPQSINVGISDLLASMKGSSGPVSPASSTAGGSPSAGFQPCDVATSAPSTTPQADADLYLITLAAAEGLCGTEEVFGRVGDAPGVTAADRPWRIEGILLGLVPLTPGPLVTSSAVSLTPTHLRSRVASACFAAEKQAGRSLISAEGLATGTWCLGATAVTGDAIFLGVLARTGGSTLFLDEWAARRERIETSAQRYWAGRMAMRPWNVFLAQVLQFQCQLAELLRGGGISAAGETTTLFRLSAALIGRLTQQVRPGAAGPADADDEADAGDEAEAADEAEAGAAEAAGGQAPAEAPLASDKALTKALADYRKNVADVLAGRIAPSSQVLIDGGIVELPPAGYLPVNLDPTVAIETQVTELLGPGVDLRFCSMRHDEAGFQFTRGQHLDRISLLIGLESPRQRPQVDILVPDGIQQNAAAKADPPAEASIKPTLDWVLFRRRSDVACGPQIHLDTVTLWAATAPNEITADLYWRGLVGGTPAAGSRWQKVGELQFAEGKTSLVTAAATVQGWWSSAGIGGLLEGAAYAPAAGPADQVALGRASNLVTALSPAASGHPTVRYDPLTVPPPEPVESGAEGALFVVAWPATVTIGVWRTTLPYPPSEQLWQWITGTSATSPPSADWTHAGTAVLTITTPPTVLSWTNQPTTVPGWFHQAGYLPGTLATGSAGVQALLDRLGVPKINQATPLLVTRPPNVQRGRPGGEDGRVFIIATNPNK
jgi:hypothetical protein